MGDIDWPRSMSPWTFLSYVFLTRLANRVKIALSDTAKIEPSICNSYPIPGQSSLFII